MSNAREKEKELAAKEAVKYIQQNQVVGLGTGSTAKYAMLEIAALVKKGLHITGVPTSNATKELAISLGIPVTDITAVQSVDITIDGADEFTTDFMLIKGGGGALFKEKVVASVTKQEIIIADSTKKVAQLGKFKLPIEIDPAANDLVLSSLLDLQATGSLRMIGNKPFISDQGNYIIDADFGLIPDPVYLSNLLNQLKGIVEHGLFIGLTHMIIMGEGDAAVTFRAE